MATILQQIARVGAKHERIVEKLIREPGLVTEVLTGVAAETARVKFGSAKVLMLIAERRPALLYPHFESFVALLDHPNKILQWNAVIILSHLARVDKKGKFDRIFEKYFAPISGPIMITAANIIGGGARVALARPEWADRIAQEILKVEQASYATAECRNVAIGHAITALQRIHDLLEDKATVQRFFQNQLRNPRPAVRRKAETALRLTNGRR